MKHTLIRTNAFLTALSLTGILLACQAKPEETKASLALNESKPIPLTCQYNRAMESCCPVYCNGKKKDGALRATENFLSCATGFGCGRSDVHAARCELNSNCK